MSSLFGSVDLVTLILGVCILILFILVIVLFSRLSKEKQKREKLETRINRFVRGHGRENMEDVLVRMFEEHDEIMREQKDTKDSINEITRKIRTMIQKVGIVKYDAFNQMGGNLSSAIALLDEENSGLIINTVQSVDGCYSYVKEVRKGKPDIDLSREENQALEKAMKGNVSRETGRKEAL